MPQTTREFFSSDKEERESLKRELDIMIEEMREKTVIQPMREHTVHKTGEIIFFRRMDILHLAKLALEMIEEES